MQAHSHLRGRRAETDTMLARAARLRELACALFLAEPSAIREHQQRRGRFVQRAHEALRMVRCVFEEVVRDPFEIRGCLLGPPEFHQRRDCCSATF